MTNVSFLQQIIDLKRERIASLIAESKGDALRQKAFAARNSRTAQSLRAALSDQARINCIAEFKRASPSKGGIRLHADPVQIARAYEAGGAAAISVLTEEDRFLGSIADLQAVRAAVNIPVLRKDFIFDPAQVYESAIIGADALLLIVAALDDETLHGLRELTEEVLGLDALVEVHTAEEMARARRCGATIIGINNRNLHTFEVSLETSLRLIGDAPPGAILISESGLRDGNDLRRLRAAGFSGFLVGESLMRSADPAAALGALLGEASSINAA